jgi:hypothetical protein
MSESDAKLTRMRESALDELVMSEATYIRDLYTLQNVYIEPLQGDRDFMLQVRNLAKVCCLSHVCIYSTLCLYFDLICLINHKFGFVEKRILSITRNT